MREICAVVDIAAAVRWGRRRWHRAFDTACPAPEDAADPGAEPVVADDAFYLAGGRSAVVLVSA